MKWRIFNFKVRKHDKILKKVWSQQIKYMLPSSTFVLVEFEVVRTQHFSTIWHAVNGCLLVETLVSNTSSCEGSSCWDQSRPFLHSILGEKGRVSPMTKAPTPTEISKKHRDHIKTEPKTSITQRLRTDLGRSVGVTAVNPTGDLGPLTGIIPPNFYFNWLLEISYRRGLLLFMDLA